MQVQNDVKIEGYRHRIRLWKPDGVPHSQILALHGFGTSGLSFRHVVSGFSSHGIEVAAPDQLGFGDSEKPSGVYSLDLYARLTVGLADAAGLERPFLLGHSAGGKIAAVTVAAHPKRFRGLILVNTGGFSRLAPVLLLADTSLFRVIDRPFIRREILSRFNIARTVESPEQWEAFRRIHGNNRALDIDTTGYRKAVRAIDLPVLLIWGQKDRMIPRGTPKRVLRDIPHAEYVAMPGSGHTPMRDEPEAFCDHVIRFIESSGDGTESGRQ